ncbi:MAG: hypothetical protein K9G67_08970 [Bacteroidales bacterium]|nr:hypothetical protein [Bacteroidales bacterium]MCF8344564.1 hypothetical protein [Bacteroidales bacterium]MCF8350341.1 hypothetical protein [Bacteroidales bacterium]MCF8376473.1 hypothetical protein [Bacteroidales bacterium]
MRLFLLITVLTISSLFVRGQEYRQYAGLRGGVSSGISYKLFKNEVKALEALLAYRDGGIQFTALIETYKPLYLKNTDRLYMYTGLGAHIGYTSWHRGQTSFLPLFRTRFFNRNFSPVIGLDIAAGLEYRFYNTPLVLGLNIKPFFDIFGRNFFNLHLFDVGFSIHYTF